MTCAEVQNKLASYLDQELGKQEQIEIEQHLSICSICARELEILTSIDAIGKIEIFSEPAPPYWNQLRHNIMQQLPKPKAKPSRLSLGLAQLKRWLWPEKISYRLVGLAATAVVVFFVVRLSLLNQEKLVAPDKVSSADSAGIAASKPNATPPQSSMERAEQSNEFRQEMELTPPARKAKSGLPTDNQLATAPALPPAALPEEHRKLMDLTEMVPMATEKANDSMPPAHSELKPVGQIESKIQPRSTETINISNPVQFHKSQIRVNATSEQFLHSPADSSRNQFDHIREYVKSFPSISTRISFWDHYLKARPESQFSHQVVYELAGLYFQLAHDAPTPANVDRAFAFYSENAAILFLSPDSIRFKEQFNAIRSLKKNKKN